MYACTIGAFQSSLVSASLTALQRMYVSQVEVYEVVVRLLFNYFEAVWVLTLANRKRKYCYLFLFCFVFPSHHIAGDLQLSHYNA